MLCPSRLYRVHEPLIASGAPFSAFSLPNFSIFMPRPRTTSCACSACRTENVTTRDSCAADRSTIFGKKDKRGGTCRALDQIIHGTKIDPQNFFQKKCSFLKFFCRFFRPVPALNSHPKTRNPRLRYRSLTGCTALRKYPRAENCFQYRGLHGYQKPKGGMRKIVIKFASNTHKN